MEKQKAIVVEISTECICSYCPACGIGYSGQEECDNCGGEVRASDECFECQPTDYLEEYIEEWCKNKESIKISGTRVTWRNLSGYDLIDANCKSILDYLTFSGDWRLSFTIGKSKIKVKRYSHDEPMGAYFEIIKAPKVRDLTSVS